jgi:hypothetical protein
MGGYGMNFDHIVHPRRLAPVQTPAVIGRPARLAELEIVLKLRVRFDVHEQAVAGGQ